MYDRIQWREWAIWIPPVTYNNIIYRSVQSYYNNNNKCKLLCICITRTRTCSRCGTTETSRRYCYTQNVPHAANTEIICISLFVLTLVHYHRATTRPYERNIRRILYGIFEYNDVCESRDHNRYVRSSRVLLCE